MTQRIPKLRILFYICVYIIKYMYMYCTVSPKNTRFLTSRPPPLCPLHGGIILCQPSSDLAPPPPPARSPTSECATVPSPWNQRGANSDYWSESLALCLLYGSLYVYSFPTPPSFQTEGHSFMSSLPSIPTFL
jgi:hypothetical protein